MGLIPNNTAGKRQKGRVRQSDRQTESRQVAWISHSLQGFVCELWSERVAAECLQKKKKAAINAWISCITAEATHRTKGQNTWGESHGHAHIHTHTQTAHMHKIKHTNMHAHTLALTWKVTDSCVHNHPGSWTRGPLYHLFPVCLCRSSPTSAGHRRQSEGRGVGEGLYAGSWGVTEESSVMLIAVLIVEALRAAACVWSPWCG